ncbi:unnamed protein product [Linum tenue]|uniref:Uncharacterized protein n=2 Tax=Linum tenue TaxID=586396 RepID=A0AAV0HR15_9ROSI|nr:unnamed protein product [Linum tenue]
MEEIKKKKINGGGSGSGSEESTKKKERHIVTWSSEEDDILRQQITLHGTENWAIIASKFNDKTTRQCRRRWYTYLNSDFKKGGWSQEEDLLLCEAQRIFGNRWTEIAKVVSGRTDNAVKNRFTTLCKKRAKYEALAKENESGFSKSNNKRVLLDDKVNTDRNPEIAGPAKRTRYGGTSEKFLHLWFHGQFAAHLLKSSFLSLFKLRMSHIPNEIEARNLGGRSHPKQARPPFMVLARDAHKVNAANQHPVINNKDVSPGALSGNTQGTFLKKDDLKISALMQQAELLSKLAQEVNTENTNQSLEHAWKVLQDFLKKSKGDEIPNYTIFDIDIQLEDFKDLIAELRSSSDGSHPSWRQPDLYEQSPASSEFSTGSSLMPYSAPDITTEKPHSEIEMLHKDVGSELEAMHVEGQEVVESECHNEIASGDNIAEGELFPSFEDQTNDDIVVSSSSSTEFGSPRQVTPLFRSLAAGIPSPQFSESERRFLLKTLGGESPFSNQSINTSQPPLCKRVLLQSL